MQPSATRYRDRVFGTDISLAGLSDPAAALQRLRDIDASLTRFHSKSDLSTLNSNRAGPLPLEFLSLLVGAIDWMNRTGGLVSPFLGRAIVSLGYDRDYSELPEIRDLHDPVGLEDGTESVGIDADSGWVELPDGLDLDLGGFAKGWAADLLRATDPSPRGMANIGGDLRAWSDGEPWQVVTDGGIAFALTEGAVATSSTQRRTWNTSTGRMHHIIDPRTGRPSATDCVQATVITETGLAAEALAKLAVLSGMDAAPSQLTALDPAVGWILTDTTGRVDIGGTLCPALT